MGDLEQAMKLLNEIDEIVRWATGKTGHLNDLPDRVRELVDWGEWRVDEDLPGCRKIAPYPQRHGGDELVRRPGVGGVRNGTR